MKATLFVIENDADRAQAKTLVILMHPSAEGDPTQETNR
jgi:hypothetical protein